MLVDHRSVIGRGFYHSPIEPVTNATRVFLKPEALH